MRPRLRRLLLAPGRLGLRFALDCSRRFFGLRSVVAVSSVAHGRIEFVSRAIQARQFYGLSFRFQLLSTPCRQDAVTFNSWREAPPQRDFHPPMHALSQAHDCARASAALSWDACRGAFVRVSCPRSNGQRRRYILDDERRHGLLGRLLLVDVPTLCQ